VRPRRGFIAKRAAPADQNRGGERGGEDGETTLFKKQSPLVFVDFDVKEKKNQVSTTTTT